jgi:LysR family transcriptional regulator, benzoate and cis,cis-muconate-responsive activator of ben and cat genes
MEAVDLRHLRYFVAVAEELHFSRAARRLNVSQPPLSQQIRQLERAIGAPLFVRTSRRVELTPAGSALLVGARRTLAEAARSLDAAERAGRGEVDHLRVGFTGSGALGGLVETVRSFRAQHPLVHLEMIEGTTESQLEAVDRDLVDVALVRGPVAASRARVEVVRREPFVAALPADHRLTVRRVVPIAALKDEPWVLFPRHVAPPHHDVLTGICQRAGFEPSVRHESAEYDTILSLVAAGLGVTLVPASVRRLRFEGVEFRRLSGVQATAELAVVYQPHRLSRALSAFIRCAAR